MVNETFQLSWILLNFVNNWKFYAFHHLFKLNNMYSNRGTTDNSCTVCDASSGAGLLFLPLSAQIKQKQWACNLLLFFFFCLIYSGQSFEAEIKLSTGLQPFGGEVHHGQTGRGNSGQPRAPFFSQHATDQGEHTQIEETGSPEWTAIVVHQEAKIFNILILLFFV